MPKRKSPYPEKPWHPDPAKWQRHLEDRREDKTKDLAKCEAPTQPVKGWQLWNWNTLEDVKQTT